MQILIVDDELDIRELVSGVLTDEGYETRTAADSDGALEFNIGLSKRRAASVRKHLLDVYGLDGDRIDAEGNGYLSPLQSNLDASGRTANRRVEAVVLPLK